MKCECGYEKTCQHTNVTDIYVTSALTGEFTATEHQVMHYYERKCSDCGEKISERVLGALGHDEIAHEGKEPTCTEKGSVSNTCSICNTTETSEIDSLRIPLYDKAKML